MFAQRNLSRRRAAVYRCVLRWKHAVARDRFLQLVVLLLTITFVLILGACGLVAEARWYHSELVAMTSQLSRDSNELMNMAGKSSHWTIVSARQDRYAEATRHLFALHRELTRSETQLASHRDLLRNDAVMPFAEGLNVTAAARVDVSCGAPGGARPVVVAAPYFSSHRADIDVAEPHTNRN
jgi:uncharacterized membrane protein YqjE